MSYHGLGFLEDQAQELASYAADLMEDEMRQRLPGIIQGLQPSLQSSINQLQPTINAAATKAMKAAMQDEAFKAAVAGTEGKIMTYGIVGGLGVVVATSLLTWWLVKGLCLVAPTWTRRATTATRPRTNSSTGR